MSYAESLHLMLLLRCIEGAGVVILGIGMESVKVFACSALVRSVKCGLGPGLLHRTGTSKGWEGF